MHRIQGLYTDSIGQLIAGWFTRETGKTVHGPYSAIGWIKDTKIVGQALFVDYTGSNIEIHLNAPRCMSRKTIKDVYSYVFKVSKCNRLTAKPYADNEKLLQLLPRLGFVYECTLSQYYGEPDAPVDAVVYKLTKENALRWIDA